MKKVLAMILTLSMLLALAACGGPAESATSAAASQQTEGNPSSTPDSPAENEATPAPAVRTVDADKDTLIVGGFGEVTSFDPLTEGTNTMNIIGLCVYDKLYNMNQDGNLEMELAESVEYVGDDGMTLEIKLKSGIKFHNGDELTAEDVLFTIQRMSTNFMYSSRVDAADFDKATAEGLTVTIPMKYYDARFVPNLTGELGFIMDKSYVEQVGEEEAGRNPVGTGPYTFGEWKAGESVTLNRNTDYWSEQPDFETIVYKFFTEDNTRVLEFEQGTLDLAVVETSDNVDRLKNGEVPGGMIYTWMTNKQGNFVMNTNNEASPFYGNRNLRLAIAHAVDWKAVAETIGGSTVIAAASSMPSNCAAFEAHPYEYDPEMAKQYLSDAGYPDGFAFTAMIASNQGTDVKMAEAIKAYLSQVGIDMTIESMDLFTLMGYQMSGEQVAGMVDNTIRGDDFEIFQTFAAGSGNMLCEVENEEFQKALTEVISERDPGKRVGLFKQAQAALHDDASYIPIYQNVGSWAYQDYVNMGENSVLTAEKVVDFTKLSFAR